MIAYTLKVKVLFSPNSPTRILTQLHRDFALVCTRHGGTVESPDPSDTTFYEHRCVSMTDESDSLESEVKALRDKYPFPHILFGLEESKVNGIIF